MSRISHLQGFLGSMGGRAHHQARGSAMNRFSAAGSAGFMRCNVKPALVGAPLVFAFSPSWEPRNSTEVGFDARKMAGFFDVLDRIGEQTEEAIPGWLSSHPHPADREERILERGARSGVQAPAGQPPSMETTLEKAT